MKNNDAITERTRQTSISRPLLWSNLWQIINSSAVYKHGVFCTGIDRLSLTDNVDTVRPKSHEQGSRFVVFCCC